MFEGIVKLFFEDVTEQNRKKTAGAITVTYRTILLGIVALIFYFQQNNRATLDNINAQVVKISNQQQASVEYRQEDIKDHDAIRAELKLANLEFDKRVSRLEFYAR